MTGNVLRVARTSPPLLVVLLTLGLACDESRPARDTLSVAQTLADADTAGFARATEPRPLRFPEDHGPHPDFKHEWWYCTGNLAVVDESGSRPADQVGREFGFQLTFFRSALRPDSHGSTVESPWATRQAYMGHFALSDIRGRAFHAFERFDRGALELAGAEGAPMRVWIGDWEVQWVADTTTPAPDALRVPAGSGFRVRAREADVGVDLVLRPLKPAVLQGDSGLSRKGPEPGNASLYYSMMRLDARGVVSLRGARYPVAGVAWLDREWGTSALGPGIAGWDWFSLQLDDDSELMLYRLRQEDGDTAPFSAATFSDTDGAVTHLSVDDFELDETGRWTSRRGGTYPSGWRIRIPPLELSLRVEPRLLDQELDLAFRYGEGAVTASGRRDDREVAGKGYVELTGY